VDAGRRRVEVSTMEDGKGAMGPYDHIVNCAWAGRPALDRSAGLNLGNPWTFRMKYFVTASTTPHTPVLPSTTVVLGGFGDIVDYGDGDVYLSWYPAGRRGWSTELIPPAWPTRPDPGAASEITELTVSHLRDVHPGVAGLSIFGPHGPDVRGGVIYSLGNTDVDDPKSVFHRRSDVGLRSAGSYHSVDTGKYTTAPLFAELVADRITGAR
ncbi:MAG TPA: hypothetical protein VFP42_01650, partial [Acidimicrobiia bacterium]|nr:hypothetical protein [Acidimicrobiia bacterium]